MILVCIIKWSLKKACTRNLKYLNIIDSLMECFSNSCKNKVKMVCKTWEDGSTLMHCCVLKEHLSAAFVSTKQVFQLTRPKKSSFSNSFSLSPPLLKCHATALEWVRIHIHVCV